MKALLSSQQLPLEKLIYISFSLDFIILIMSDNENFDANVELSEVESPKEPRKKKTCSELFQQVSDLNTQMEELDNDFISSGGKNSLF